MVDILLTILCFSGFVYASNRWLKIDFSYALMTFPTPTFLYRIAHFIAEKLGIWIFHDERPLPIKKALEMEYSIIWSIIFTQGVVVCSGKNNEQILKKYKRIFLFSG